MANQRPAMTLFEVKNAMQLDMLLDSHRQQELWEVIKKLIDKKDVVKADLQELDAPGRVMTNLEQVFATYLKKKLAWLDSQIGMAYDAHFALRDAIANTETWQGYVNEDVTVDQILSRFEPTAFQ
jgi:hypothetical protein